MSAATAKTSAGTNAKSALIAGVVALVVYFVTSALFAGYSSGVLPMSLAVGVSTFLVAWLVTTLISAARKRELRRL